MRPTVVMLASVFVALGSGCSLILDFSDSAIPKDAAIDMPYTQAECDYKETNDTLDTAAMITTADVGPAAICAGATEDHDFYRFTVPAGTTSVIIKIAFTSSPTGDLDLRLYDGTTHVVISQSRGFGDNEMITCPASSPACAMLAAGDYIFEVFPAVNGAVNAYDISLMMTP